MTAFESLTAPKTVKGLRRRLMNPHGGKYKAGYQLALRYYERDDVVCYNILVEATNNCYPNKTCISAISSIGLLGRKGATAISVLISALNEENVVIVNEAIRSLANLKEGAAAAVSALEKYISHSDQEVRTLAGDALATITGDASFKDKVPNPSRMILHGMVPFDDDRYNEGWSLTFIRR